MEGDVGSDD